MINQTVLKRQLTRAGHRVSVANNGLEGAVVHYLLQLAHISCGHIFCPSGLNLICSISGLGRDPSNATEDKTDDILPPLDCVLVSLAAYLFDFLI